MNCPLREAGTANSDRRVKGGRTFQADDVGRGSRMNGRVPS